MAHQEKLAAHRAYFKLRAQAAVPCPCCAIEDNGRICEGCTGHGSLLLEGGDFDNEETECDECDGSGMGACILCRAYLDVHGLGQCADSANRAVAAHWLMSEPDDQEDERIWRRRRHEENQRMAAAVGYGGQL